MENTNISDLTTLIDQIESNQILLPDFQREFVWKNVEQQKKLVASVLAKMPIGSILLLKSSNPREFSAKALGRKQSIETSKLPDDVQYLLDGQQRMTVLTNVFSNAIFLGLSSVNELVSPQALKRRFFISLPKWQADISDDVFGFHGLNFPVKKLGNEPIYLSGDMLPNIEVIEFTKNDGKPFNPFTKETKTNAMAAFCHSKDDCYLIPLYLLASNETKNSIMTNRIKVEIENDYISDFNDDFKKLSLQKQQELWSTNFVFNLEEGREVEEILKERFEVWWDNFSNYLRDCIKNLMLNQIVVAEAQRGRAIDIYENLNRGGVSLNTFDLMTAKVAVVSSEGLYQRIIDCIQEPTEIDSSVLPEGMETEFGKLTIYQAADNIGCYDENKNTIAKKYLDAFLDTLSMCCYNPELIPEGFKLDYTKQDKILGLEAKAIDENVSLVCKSIDRACFFLQARCGIRKISEVNNLFVLVLLACIFTKDEYFHNKKVHNLLEAWYWCVIFSGEFDKDQNKNFIKNIQQIMKMLRNDNDKDPRWLKAMQGMILNAPNYSDRDLLLYKKVDEERYPKKNLSDYICQYFLSRPYRSMFDNDELISVFSSQELEAHHIVPLGSVKAIGKVTSALRKNPRSIYNSPINFIYITKQDNIAISDKSVNDYIQKITPEAKSKLLLDGFQNDKFTEDDAEKFFEVRFDRVQGEIRERVRQLLDTWN